MSDERAVLFVLRSHNEVDQISPILYQLGQRNNVRADVVLAGAVSPQDYRIELLSSYDNIRLYHDGSAAESGPSIKGRLLNRVKAVGRRLPTEIPERLYMEYVGKQGLPMYETLPYREYSVIAFDWTLAKHYMTDQLVELDDVTTVVLPHGDSPFRNRLIKQTKFQEFLQDSRNFVTEAEQSEIGFDAWGKLLDHDHLLFPNVRTARRVGDPDRHEQISVLGSPRYNEEWLNVIAEARPTVDIDWTGELHVVMFVRRARYFVSQGEVERTIDLLSRFENVQTIVKEHPRDRLLDPSLADGIPNVHIVKDEYQSVSLIEWGDVFLSLGTTIVFEPIMRRNPVLALEYAHANHSVEAAYFAETDMRCKDDLYHRLHDLLAAGTSNFYHDENHDRFVREMVTNSNTSVLDSWARSIENLIVTDR